MYWWNVSKLAEDFREGRVEEKERFKYFLATSIAWFLVAQPFLYYGQTFKIVDLISAVVGLTITIAGIILCYGANRSGDNSDFIGRMVCLSWPILIKVAVLCCLIFLFALAFMDLGLGLDTESSQAVDAVGILLVGLFGIYYYWLIYKYITLVAHARASSAVLE